MIEKRYKLRRFRDRPRFQRGVSIIPSIFTIGNIFCGYYSIIATMKGNYDYAAIAIGIGTLLDALDGRIARMTNTASDFGLELDSLADVLSFGIAPAALAFKWGVSSMEGMQAGIAGDVHQFGWLVTFAFVICGSLRLARFNIQARWPVDGHTSKRYFVGLPIPAAAGMVASVIHFGKTPILQVGSALLWCFLIATVAILMISRVRYYSFKEIDLVRPHPRLAMFAVAMLIGLVILYSEVVLLSLATVYVSSGPVARVTQIVRRTPSSSLSPSEHLPGNLET